MTTKAKQIGVTLLTVALIAAGIAVAAQVLRPSTPINAKDRVFFEDSLEYDVIFYGNSHIDNAVFPMQLWHDWGITSFNLSAHGMNMPASYWLFRDSLRYHVPKVAVLDIWEIAMPKAENNMNQIHRAFDARPTTLTKIRAYLDMFGLKGFAEIFPFALNHCLASAPLQDLFGQLHEQAEYFLVL